MLIGIILVALMVVLSVGQAETVQRLQTHNFAKPFFIAYATVSAYLLCGPLSMLPFLQGKVPMDWRRLAKVALLLAALDGPGIFMWYWSLDAIPVSASLAIFNAVPAVVFVLSVLVFREDIKLMNAAAVLLACGGVLCIAMFAGGISASPGASNNSTLPPSPQQPDTTSPSTVSPHVVLRGYILAVAVVFCTAIYELSYDKLLSGVRDGDNVGGALRTLFLVGCWSVLLTWPLFFVLHYTGVETFELPTGPTLYVLLANVAQFVSYNLCLLIGISFTSPLFVATGSLLTIPISLVVAYFLSGSLLAPVALLGCGLIALAFLALVLPWDDIKQRCTGGEELEPVKPEKDSAQAQAAPAVLP
jgi:drug/metabolite transporter (DMT)-like permease